MFGFLKRYFELRYQRRIQTLKTGAEAFCKKHFSPPPKEQPSHCAKAQQSLGKTHAVSLQEKPQAKPQACHLASAVDEICCKQTTHHKDKRYSIVSEKPTIAPKDTRSEDPGVRFSISSSFSPSKTEIDILGKEIDLSRLSHYIDDSRSDSFVARLLRIMREKGLSAPSVYRAANMSKQLYSKIVSNLYYQPSRDTAIALAFALRLTFEQAQDFIGRAGFQLTHSDERDVILEFFLKEEFYKLLDINVVLHDMGKKPLGY